MTDGQPSNHAASDDAQLRCPDCGDANVTTEMVEERFGYDMGADAVELRAIVPMRTCHACGFRYTDAEGEDARHEAVCRHLGVMTPAQIRHLRGTLHGLSRAEFVQLTKLGEATLGRWERGEVIQNAAYDQYLYLIGFEDNLDRLRSRAAGLGAPPSPPGVAYIEASFESDAINARLRDDPEGLREEQKRFQLVRG